jgi:hypothetical protein
LQSTIVGDWSDKGNSTAEKAKNSGFFELKMTKRAVLK